MGLLSLIKDRKDRKTTAGQSSIKKSPISVDSSRQNCDICWGFRPDPAFAAQNVEYPFTSHSITLFFNTFLAQKAEDRKWVPIGHGKFDSDFSDVPAPKYPAVRAWKLSSRNGCQSCKLIDEVTENVSFQQIIKNKWGFLSMDEVEGLHCVALSLTNGPLQLIFVNASQTRGRDRFALLELHGLPGNPNIHPLIGNRPLVCARNNDENAIRKIERWLNTCNSHHDCVPPNTWQSYMPRRILRVDMADSQNFEMPVVTLVENAEPERYVALSYCWGKNEAAWVRTTTSNIRDHLKGVNSDSCRLPSTINDMALLVFKLGIKYLWVDALCIFQDSADDWEVEAAKMGDIYSHAYLVICADVSGDCFKSAGVLQIGGNLLSTMMLNTGELGDEMPKCLRFPGWRHHEQFAPLRPAYLDSRGWTFQERILPRRYVRLTDYEMYWECLGTGLICECSEPCDRDGHPRNPSADRKTGNRITDVIFFPSSHSGMNYSDIRNTLLDPDTNATQRHLAWQAIVEEYSRRELTQDSDKLAAISGIARKMGQSLVGKDSSAGRHFYAGLWYGNLIQDLTWEAVGFHPRMAKSLLLQADETPRPVTLVLTELARQKNKFYVAPSWSWASSRYPVKYWNQPGDLFKKLERFKPSAKLLVAVIDNSKADEYGTVRHGQLELTGRLDPVELRAAHLPSEQTIKNWGLEPGRDIVRDYADSSLYPFGKFLFYAKDSRGKVVSFKPDNASVIHPPDAEHDHPCRELFTTLVCRAQGCACHNDWKGSFWALLLGQASYIAKENSPMGCVPMEVQMHIVLKKVEDTEPPTFERVGVIKCHVIQPLPGGDGNLEMAAHESRVRIV